MRRRRRRRGLNLIVGIDQVRDGEFSAGTTRHRCGSRWCGSPPCPRTSSQSKQSYRWPGGLGRAHHGSSSDAGVLRRLAACERASRFAYIADNLACLLCTRARPPAFRFPVRATLDDAPREARSTRRPVGRMHVDEPDRAPAPASTPVQVAENRPESTENSIPAPGTRPKQLENRAKSTLSFNGLAKWAKSAGKAGIFVEWAPKTKPGQCVA